MKMSVNYEFDFGTAINPATKKRERIAVVSREYHYKDQINDDWDETLWMFWVKGSLLKFIDGETSEKAILDHLMFFVQFRNFSEKNEITGSDFDKYQIDLDRWHTNEEV